jgi:hypothetical protein
LLDGLNLEQVLNEVAGAIAIKNRITTSAANKAEFQLFILITQIFHLSNIQKGYQRNLKRS